jgi:hypothetical protein
MLVIAAVMLAVLPVVSFAANENEASVIVSYTKDATTPSEPEPPTATYTVDIPSTFSLNTGRSFFVTANYSNVNDGQFIEVSIDENTFSEDGRFYLKNNNPEKIEVTISRWNRGRGVVETVYSGDYVARFGPSITDIDAFGEVVLDAVPSDLAALQPGTYTGTLYFKIALVNE